MAHWDIKEIFVQGFLLQLGCGSWELLWLFGYLVEWGRIVWGRVSFRQGYSQVSKLFFTIGHGGGEKLLSLEVMGQLLLWSGLGESFHLAYACTQEEGRVLWMTAP